MAAGLLYGGYLLLSQLPAQSLESNTSVPVTQNNPIRLKISKIEVDAKVQNMGLTEVGEMDVPSNLEDVGWYQLGPKPGEQGNAVITGHFNGPKGEAGVFLKLDQLKVGDQIEVTNYEQKTITFIVKKIQLYNPGYAEEVFMAKDLGIHLNLITCDGVWDISKKSYTKRLVIFTDLMI